jgi:hypothetical protein
MSDEGDAVENDVLAQQLKVDRSIGVAIQDEAPPVPTLRQMVWYVNGNHTCESVNRPMPGNDIRNHFGLLQVLHR